MKSSLANKTILGIIILSLLTPIVTLADPPGPGGGGDPYATPVNGYIAFVAIVAFIYGSYRLYTLAPRDRTNDTDF